MKRLPWVIVFSLMAAVAIAYYVKVDVSAAPTQLTFDAISRGDMR